MEKLRHSQMHFFRFCDWKVLVVMVTACVFSVILAVMASHGDSKLRDLFEVCHAAPDSSGIECSSEPWKALVVGNVLLLSVVLMAQDWRAEFVLFTAAVFFGLLGIIDADRVLCGFSSPGNIGVQGILVLVRGMQDAGVLDRIFASLLGLPKGRAYALLRSQVLAACVSAIFSGGPVVFAGGATMCSWARQIGMTPREVLMPFVSAASVGQNLLLVSSAVSLVVATKMPSADLRLLDPVPISLVIYVITFAYGVLTARPLLGPRPEQSLELPVVASVARDRYVVHFQLSEASMLLGRSLAGAGLLGLPGATYVGNLTDAERPLVPSDRLCFLATAAGVAALRSFGHGFIPSRTAGQHSKGALGGRRHQRRLFEAMLSSESALLGQDLPLQMPHALCLGARRPGGVGDAGEFVGPMQAGDVLLVEAFSNFPELSPVRDEFMLTAAVPGSAPPRHGRRLDTCRGWFAMVLLLGVLALASLQVSELVILILSACVICVALNVVHPKMVLKSLNLPLFLLIASGVGVSEAMAESGLAVALAKLVVQLGLNISGGSLGVLVALGLITSMLSNLMSNTATAALMAPIALQVCSSHNVRVKTVALLLIYSSNSAFSSPFGTPMHSFVKKIAPYEFADYIRYGIPLQLIHAVIVPTLCVSLWGVDP